MTEEERHEFIEIMEPSASKDFSEKMNRVLTELVELEHIMKEERHQINLEEFKKELET